MTSINSGPAEASLTRPWPADRVERWPIERLIPYANNPRLHSEADLDKIAASILKWGWTNPALVDEDSELIAGHGRVLFRELGSRKAATIEQPVARSTHQPVLASGSGSEWSNPAPSSGESSNFAAPRWCSTGAAGYDLSVAAQRRSA